MLPGQPDSVRGIEPQDELEPLLLEDRQIPDLEDLLDYISNEIKELLDMEGALVMLLDEEKRELFASDFRKALDNNFNAIFTLDNAGFSMKLHLDGKKSYVTGTWPAPPNAGLSRCCDMGSTAHRPPTTLNALFVSRLLGSITKIRPI